MWPFLSPSNTERVFSFLIQFGFVIFSRLGEQDILALTLCPNKINTIICGLNLIFSDKSLLWEMCFSRRWVYPPFEERRAFERKIIKSIFSRNFFLSYFTTFLRCFSLPFSLSFSHFQSLRRGSSILRKITLNMSALLRMIALVL